MYMHACCILVHVAHLVLNVLNSTPYELSPGHYTYSPQLTSVGTHTHLELNLYTHATVK